MRLLFILALLALPLTPALAIENADDLSTVQNEEGPSTSGGGNGALTSEEQGKEICRAYSGQGFNPAVKRRSGPLFGGDGRDPSYYPRCGINTDL